MEIIVGKKIYKLAFSGKMGAGKTSGIIASLEYLSDLYGPENVIGYAVKFAQPLYQCMVSFHRFTKGNAERTFLQRLGDLARREFGDDIMERLFAENVESVITNKLPTLTQEHVLISCDDLRFVGEYKLLKKLGFTTIGVEASEDIRRQRLGDAYTNVKHRSEVELSLFNPDHVIHNNVQEPFLATFENDVKNLLNEIKIFEG